jgi:hypothetical protein
MRAVDREANHDLLGIGKQVVDAQMQVWLAMQ